MPEEERERKPVPHGHLNLGREATGLLLWTPWDVPASPSQACERAREQRLAAP